MIWVRTVCDRGFLNISADEKADDVCCNCPLSVNYKNIKEILIKNKGKLSLFRAFQKTLVSFIT